MFMILIMVFGILWLFTSLSYADLYLNLFVVNASEKKADAHSVRYRLPDGLNPDDLLDLAGLKVEYDVDRVGYYLIGSIELGPKESKTLKVKVKDVWHFKEEDIKVLKEQMDHVIKTYEKSKHYEPAKLFRNRAIEQLDFIYKEQENFSENIGRRIEQYRIYKEIYEKIRNDIFKLDAWEAGGIHIVAEENKTIKFVVEIENPLKDKPKMIKQKHYLPSEIKPKDILDYAGFEIRFDEKKQKPYLFKEEEFSPGQVKRYSISIKDIWRIAQSAIDFIRKEAEKTNGVLKESTYQAAGSFLFEHIIEELKKIETSQEKEPKSIEKHIGLFRINKERYGKAEKDLSKMKHLMAAYEHKRLEVLELSKVKNILHKIKQLTGLKELSDLIFSRRLSPTVVWKFIFGVTAFVGVLTLINFFTWLQRSKKMGEEDGLKPGESFKKVSNQEEVVEEEKKDE